MLCHNQENPLQHFTILAATALSIAAIAAVTPGQEKKATTPAATLTKPVPQSMAKPEVYVERRDTKLASPWIELAPWSTDYDAVRAEAKRSGKKIFTYFTRSYAP